MVGCAMAASMQGAVLEGSGGELKPKKRERVSFAELQRRHLIEACQRQHIPAPIAPDSRAIHRSE
jgi:hypothetical protein